MHIIQSIRAELRATSRVAAAAASDRLSQSVRDDLPELLSVMLDELGRDGEALRIDALEVDLGVLPARIDPRDLAIEIVTQVKECLARQRPTSGAAPAPVEIWNESHEAEAEPLRDKIAAEDEPFQAFLHYLERGTLPWWFSLERWRDEIPGALVAGRAIEQLELRLVEVARRSAPALIRLFAFPELVDAILTRRSGAVMEFVRKLPPPARSDRLALAVALLELSTTRRAVEHGVDRDELVTILWRFIHRDEASAQASRALLGHLDLSGSEATDSVVVLRSLLRDPREVPGAGQLRTAPGEPSSDLLPTDSAGLVLLHPWLPSLFRNLGWLGDRDQFLPGRSWFGAQALFVLAQGRPAGSDAELVLEKTLCGIPLARAADLAELDEAVQEELHALLMAVIRNWPALKNTSADGLRESFLQRPGLLNLSARPPELRVETRAYDLLLDRLPWSVDPVVLPWLDYPLKIIWSPPH